MRYSISSRFRGALLGAAIGELAQNAKQSREGATKPSRWNGLVFLGTQSLVKLGRFDLDAWQDIANRYNSEHYFTRSDGLSQDIETLTFTKAILVALPLILLFHDNEAKLRQNLQQLVAWQDALVEQDLSLILEEALAVGYAIAQSLTEKLNPSSLMLQTTEFIGKPQSPFSQQLLQVQTLLEQGASLEKAVKQLAKNAHPSTPVALAFYCFLSTLEDFRLCVLRASSIVWPQQNPSAIAGALSGAYNSINGIPKSWRIALSNSEFQPSLAWGMKTEVEMLELADSLFAVWSGVYDPSTQSTAMMPTPAIAAPRVIGSR